MKSIVLIFSAIGLLFACNGTSTNESQALKAKEATIDSMQAVLAKKAVIDSMNAVMAAKEEKIKAESEEKDKQVVANNNVAPVAAKRKKGWNHTAKGAVVGAGTGAVTGAIINKKRAEGAIVGTLIGAGVGAGTGALVDRSKKRKNEAN